MLTRGETVTIIGVKGTKPGFEEYVWVEHVTTKAGQIKFAVFMKDEVGEDTQIERYNDHAKAVEVAAVWAIGRTAYLCGGGK